MTTLDDLAARMETAIGRINAAVESGAMASAGESDAPMAEKVRTLTHENQQLQTELSDIKAMREQDLAELDGLVAQLKPLIGEA